MKKKLAVAFIIALLGIFLLYELRIFTASLFVFMFAARFVVAWVVVLLWAIFLGVCVRKVLEELHIVKISQPLVVAPIVKRVGHFG